MARDVTQLLVDWNQGDQSALEELMPLVYQELHRLAERSMRRERPGHTLQPTALIHEAYLQLVDQTRIQWKNRAQFFGVSAQLMRRITLLHARSRGAAKRGGGFHRITFDEDLPVSAHQAAELVDIDEALTSLAALDPRLAKVVELRFFGGLTVEETAQTLEVSPTTVKREWRTARAWLNDRLATSAPQPGESQPGESQPPTTAPSG